MKTKLLKNVSSNKNRSYSFNGSLNNAIKRVHGFSAKEKARIVKDGQTGKYSIEEICAKEGISNTTFFKWSKVILGISVKKELAVDIVSKPRCNDERFRIVLDGTNGNFSIAEICKNETITQDQ